MAGSIQKYLPSLKTLTAPFERHPSTPEEIKDAREARASLKATLDSTQQRINEVVPQLQAATYQPDDIQPLLDAMKAGKTWYLEHTRAFAQEYEDYKQIFLGSITDTIALIKEKGPSKPPLTPSPEQQQLQAEAAQKLEAIKPKEWSEKGGWEILSDAFNAALPYLITALIVGIILRIACIHSNSYLYKEPPYRILAFVYGILGSPFLFFMYSYRYIMRIFGRAEPFVIESLIPLYESPVELTNLFDTVFTWYRNPTLAEWILQKQAEEKEAREKVLAPPPN
jgi:hypothetical protein